MQAVVEKLVGMRVHVLNASLDHHLDMHGGGPFSSSILVRYLCTQILPSRYLPRHVPPPIHLDGAARRCWARVRPIIFLFPSPRPAATAARRLLLPILIDSSSPPSVFSLLLLLPSPDRPNHTSSVSLSCPCISCFGAVSPTWKLASGLGFLLSIDDFTKPATL